MLFETKEYIEHNYNWTWGDYECYIDHMLNMFVYVDLYEYKWLGNYLIVRSFIVSVIVLWICYETESMHLSMLAYAFEAINVGNNMDLV